MNSKLKKFFYSPIFVMALSASTAVCTYKVMGSDFTNHTETQQKKTAAEEGNSAFPFHNAAYEPGYTPASVGNAPDLTMAAEKAVKAVVHIRVEAERSVNQQMIDPFEFFFGNGQAFSQPRSQAVVGFGSGVIISDDGYIITNSHVVKGSNKITVTLSDNRSFEAKLVGADAGSDVALIKVKAKDLPTLPIGNSDNLKLGEWVLAVGNPFNFTSTVTAGIVSAKSRNTVSDDPKNPRVESFIQTDAAINRGNSGGALVNAAGELVGINSMIFSETGNYAGISFAIPITLAAKIVSDLKTYGTVQRAVMGFVGTDVTEELAKEKKLKVNEGVYVADFAEISAVYAAGIEKNDVITAINGQTIKNFGELQGILGRFRPGDTIQVTVNRSGETKQYSVKLKNAEGNTRIVSEKDMLAELGAEFETLSDKVKRSYGIPYGVRVKNIKNGGKFAQAGVKNDFIMLSINDQPVYDTQSIKRMVEEARQRSNRGFYIRGFYTNGNVYNYLIK